MNMYSNHARTRCQQRCISEFEVSMVLDFGKVIRRHGADVYCMDKSGRKKVQQYLGKRTYAHIKSRLNIYVVHSDDGVIVTGANRLRHIRKINGY